MRFSGGHLVRGKAGEVGWQRRLSDRERDRLLLLDADALEEFKKRLSARRARAAAAASARRARGGRTALSLIHI